MLSRERISLTHAPHAGLKVLALARTLAGPWIGQTLADLGADVIKVRAPPATTRAGVARLSSSATASRRG